MRSRLLNFCSAGSLLLCAAVCVAWARSYGYTEAANCSTGAFRRYTVASENGRVWLEWLRESPSSHPGRRFWGYSIRRELSNWPWEQWYIDSDFVLNRWGFGLVHGFRLTPASSNNPDALGAVEIDEGRAVAVPHWFLALATALLPGLTIAGVIRRRRRVRGGRCIACGYDLRASPERCPECGTPAKYGTP